MSHWWTLRLATSEGRWPTPIAGQPGQRGPVVMSPPIARYRQVGEHKWSWGKQRIASLTPFLVLTIYIYTVYILYTVYIYYIYIIYILFKFIHASRFCRFSPYSSANFSMALRSGIWDFPSHPQPWMASCSILTSFSFLLYMEHHHNQQWVIFFLWTIKDWPRLKEKYSVYICIYIYIL